MSSFSRRVVSLVGGGAVLCGWLLSAVAAPPPGAGETALDPSTERWIAQRACDPYGLDADCPCGEDVEDYGECRTRRGDEWYCDPASNGEWRFWVQYEDTHFEGDERICPWDEL